MKQFIKENPTVAFGLALPLLLVVLFLGASTLPQLFVEKPKYNVVFSVGANGTEYNGGLMVQVVNNKAQVQWVSNGNYRPQTGKIYLYDVTRKAVREIPIPVTTETLAASEKDAGGNGKMTVTNIAVPELEALKLDSSSVSPDGYRFVSGYDTNRYGGFVSEMFFSSRYAGDTVYITKNGYREQLPLRDGTARYSGYYYNTQLVGWVLP